jgi:hypothetical protein
MTARIKRDSTWFYPDADSPEYSRALIKSLSETPEISAIARHVLGDKAMVAMEQAGIEKNLQLIKLGADETKLNTARMKLASTTGADYNQLIREAHGLQLYKERNKDQSDPTFNNIVGAIGTGLAGYTGYKKLQMADRLGETALQNYLVGR